MISNVKNQFKKFSPLPSQFSTPLGFSLIELIVVIAIIGVLSTLGMANYLNVKTKARDSIRKSDFAQLRSALELYRSDQGAYPASPLPGCGSPLTGGGATYIQKVPCDPSSASSYSYTTTGTTYQLIACLERTNDPQKDAANVAPCSGTTNWSYTTTNP